MSDSVNNKLLTSEGWLDANNITSVVSPDGVVCLVTPSFNGLTKRPFKMSAAYPAPCVEVSLVNGIKAVFKYDHVLITSTGPLLVFKLKAGDMVQCVPSLSAAPSFVEVLSVIPVGEQEVVFIGCEGERYISNGMVSRSSI